MVLTVVRIASSADARHCANIVNFAANYLVAGSTRFFAESVRAGYN